MQPTSGQIILLTCLIASAGLTAAITWLLSQTRAQGSVIREQGPKAHKAKAATPSTGGRAFLTALALIGFPGAIIIGYPRDIIGDPRAIIAVMSGLFTGFIGVADDILKIERRDSSGLKARYKLPLQIFVGLLVTASTIYLLHDDTVRIPFVHAILHIGAWKMLLGLFCYLVIVNGVNFTDGLDGLASTTMIVAALAMAGVLWTTNASSAVVPVILIGICLGFLPFNWNPAKIFMGDSGSLCLGGALAAAAIAAGLELTVLIIGLVFIIEEATVVMQVTYFRLTHGKRIFRMTPIHHAFELRGFKEPAIVIGFAAIGLIAGVIGWWSA
jgi:phospho-N-acetylmuramoyl-pentapeptide-transferase